LIRLGRRKDRWKGKDLAMKGEIRRKEVERKK
jgi:hypothetical protein